MKNDKLKMIDSARREFTGDVFDVVGLIIGENSNDRVGFVIICKDILCKIKPFTSVPNKIIESINQHGCRLKVKKQKSNKLEPTLRNWATVDKDYWGEHHVGINFLHSEYVRPIEEARVNGYLFYSMTPGNPGYVNFYGYLGNEILQKWYMPYEIKSRKFRTNVKYQIENIHGVKSNDYLWISKSSKDRVVTKRLLLGLRRDRRVGEYISKIDNISVVSESIRFTPVMIRNLKKRYRHILLTIDEDKTGLETKRFYEDSGIDVKFIPSCGFKDTSDYARGNSLKSSKELIKEHLVQWLKSEVKLSLLMM